MITDNLTITRGAGDFSHVFNYATSSPTKDILSTDKWMLQILVNTLPKLILMSVNVNGGGSDQIALDASADTVTAVIPEKEKNVIPDSGYSYKLFWFNPTTEDWEVHAYGTITSSGTAPADVEVDAIPYINDDTDVTVTTDYSPGYSDNIIYTDPGVGNTVVISLPDLIPAPKKRFIIIPLSGDYDVETEDEGTVISGETTPKTIRRQSSTGSTIIY